MGGTGKTPVVSHLLSWFLEKNIKPGVVSRGYRGHYSGVVSVEPNNSKLFGDESTMLKRVHRNIPIYLGKKRIEACDELVKRELVDVIIADDAFQHRELYRDIDIVVMDAMEPLKNYQVIPKGRAREPLETLKYADYIILNKVNLIPHRSIGMLLSMIRRHTNCPVIQSEYISGELKPLGSVSLKGWNKKALLVSGIGRPDSFEQLVIEQGIEVMEHLKYPDHYNFKESDIERILCRLKSLEAQRVIVTDKDAVKISEVADEVDHIWSLGLEMKFDPSWHLMEEGIFEKLNLGSH